MVKKNSIPERWRSLKAVGQRVPGSRFIAFKVPLKGVTNQRVTQTQKFTPKDLISTIRSLNEELGLIIDLTNTERYYTTKDLPKSVQYVKLHTAGLKIPDDATVHQFKRVVYKFLVANCDNDRLIGVHCTTGINRTGYLICRYLIDVDEWRPLHALSAFAQSRGHPIEGTVYIEDIVKGAPRSNVGIDLPPTTEETRAWDTGDRGLLELVPGNEYADFDARDQRPLPLMRARSDEYQNNGRDLFNARPGVRGLPLGDMNDDLDLRKRDFPSNLPDRLNAPERFRRPGDVGPDGRFNPGLQNRQNLLGSDPRQLMDVRGNYGPRDMQRPRGAPQEQMGFDDRMRGRQTAVQGFHEYQESPYQSAEYDDVEAEDGMHPSDGDLDFRVRLRRQEYQSLENENQRYDPRGREMMTNSIRGPFNERMDPRIARNLEGPMNARSAQLPGEPMNEMMQQRDRRMQPRDPRFMEGSVNERFPQRDIQSSRNAMDERMQFQGARPMNGPMNERIQSRDAQFMEGPMNNRMYPRDPRQMEAATNERMPPRVSKLMDLPLNERLNPKGGPAVENSMSDRIPSRDLQSLSRLITELMTPRDARSMEGPINARMHPRTEQAMDGNMNDPMHSRAGPMSQRMPQRNARAMEGLMNERMYQRDARTMQGSMNDEMYPRAMEGSVNESMYTQNVEYPLNKPRSYVNDTRPFEGRKMNPSADLPRGPNRFAPYPSLMKPGQPAANARGPPRPEMRDLRNMIPPSQNATGFPLRNRFN